MLQEVLPVGAAKGTAKGSSARCCKVYYIKRCNGCCKRCYQLVRLPVGAANDAAKGVVQVLQRGLHKALQRVLQEVLPVGAADDTAKGVASRCCKGYRKVGIAKGTAWGVAKGNA